MPEWARGWSIVWVSFPPQGSDSKPQVDLRKPDGAGVSLKVGGQSDEGVKLVGVDWVNSPKATAVITLENAGERALLYASSEIVSRRGDERPTRAQIEIQAQFFEISETNARRLGGRNSNGSRDAIGIEVLGARMSGGSPAVQILTEVQGQEFLRELNQNKSIDLLCTPAVTTNSGQKAIIEIIREFRHPVTGDATPEVSGGWIPKAFETRNCGVTLEVDPAINEAGAIVMKLCPQVVEFLGFRDIDSGIKYPVSGVTSKSFGFITSPFAPESGAIDVRGFPPGTQVRCPFSGKTILVP